MELRNSGIGVLLAAATILAAASTAHAGRVERGYVIQGTPYKSGRAETIQECIDSCAGAGCSAINFTDPAVTKGDTCFLLEGKPTGRLRGKDSQLSCEMPCTNRKPQPTQQPAANAGGAVPPPPPAPSPP